MKAKRYDMGTVYALNMGVPGITEQPGGRYVLASDYDALVEQLEAVGAGGVSLMGAQAAQEPSDMDLWVMSSAFPVDPVTFAAIYRDVLRRCRQPEKPNPEMVLDAARWRYVLKNPYRAIDLLKDGCDFAPANWAHEANAAIDASMQANS